METIQKRTERAKKKAEPLIDKYFLMNLNEKLQYIKDNREQYKKDKNIINRYYNLSARNAGFAKGMIQAEKEL